MMSKKLNARTIITTWHADLHQGSPNSSPLQPGVIFIKPGLIIDVMKSSER